MTFIPMHAQQLVIIQWMDSCIPKEEEEEIIQQDTNLINERIYPQTTIAP